MGPHPRRSESLRRIEGYAIRSAPEVRRLLIYMFIEVI
jgi:hypothetical protein